jgi:hypothetical protein
LPRSAVSTFAAFAIVANSVSSAFAAESPTIVPATRADYETCQAGDEESFRRAVEAITVKALEAGTKGIDYPGAVADAWRRLGIDEILDKRVDQAVEEVRSETGWSDLVKSLANKEKAQELATRVAERVYRSDAMTSAIEELATGVGKEVGSRIEIASQDAAGPALDCLRAFLGARYGATVAGVVAGDAERDFGLDAAKGSAEISSGAVLRQSSEGITGAAILLVRRQLANMAARIGQRLAGAVLARLVSVVAGGVGLVLIAKDLWELRSGVLPIIADEMKSKATKDKVKEELATTISEQIGEHLKEIGAKSAERIVEIWREFRAAHVKALELAERNAQFRSFLDTVKPGALARLDEVTALVLGDEGEAGVLRRLDDGTLDEAVRFLPEPAMSIARETRSIDAALKWSELAGNRLGALIEHEIYRRASPGDFTKASLARIFDLDDPIAITRLAAVNKDARETLLELDNEQLKKLARSLAESELATLAAYLMGLEKGPRARVLETVAGTPGRMQILASARVRDAVIASADQSAAVDMMLRPADGASAIAADFRAAWEGKVSAILLWEKHPVAILAALLAAVALLMMVRRLIVPRRGSALG